MSERQTYTYLLSGSGDSGWPVAPYYAVVWTDEENSSSLPYTTWIGGEWGESENQAIPFQDESLLPENLSACWLSLTEGKFYLVNESLDNHKIEELYKKLSEISDSEVSFVIGLGHGGFCTLWIRNSVKSIKIGSFWGEETDLPMEEFLPAGPAFSVEDYCGIMLKQAGTRSEMSANEIDRVQKNRDRLYNYRIVVDFEDERKNEDAKETDTSKLPKAEIEALNISCVDGSFDKSDTEGLLKSHEASKPGKIMVAWKEGKSQYRAYFRFDEERLSEIFDRFYGAHRETKSDFILRLDARDKKFGILLYRMGLKEPMELTEDTFELIVFKNKFEYYKSDNYSQPIGTWVW